ncbi:hypothetical protein BX600DRAFT_439516 [Xylariales sp. PMI_506]|nr:hypothetical protein BX600DRAFT_439516 [Xylariales sp. PMI_506]
MFRIQPKQVVTASSAAQVHLRSVSRPEQSRPETYNLQTAAQYDWPNQHVSRGGSRTMGDEHRLEHFRSMQGQYSDFTILCGDYQHKVHKAIICPRSAFFEAALKHDMKEKADGVIELEDDDPKAVRATVHYFQSGADDEKSCPQNDESSDDARQDNNVKEPKFIPLHHAWLSTTRSCDNPGKHGFGNCPCHATNEEANSAPNLVHHANIHVLADEYGIQPLKSLAAKKFETECKKWWDHSQFIEAVWILYYKTAEYDNSLRSTIISTIK